MSTHPLVEKEIVTAEIRKQADEIKKHLSVNDKGVIVSDENTFISTLPEDVTKANINKVLAVMSDYAVASKIAFSETAISHLKKNKDVQTITGTLQMHKGNIKHTMNRYASGVKPGTDEKWESWGKTSSKLTLTPVSDKADTMKKVGVFFCDEAQAALAK